MIFFSAFVRTCKDVLDSSGNYSFWNEHLSSVRHLGRVRGCPFEFLTKTARVSGPWVEPRPSLPSFPLFRLSREFFSDFIPPPFFLIISVMTLTSEPMFQLNVFSLGWAINSNTVRSVACVWVDPTVKPIYSCNDLLVYIDSTEDVISLFEVEFQKQRILSTSEEREVNRRLTCVCRCDERLKSKTEGVTHHTYTSIRLELRKHDSHTLGWTTKQTRNT